MSRTVGFRTGLITTAYDARPAPPYTGRGWQVTLRRLAQAIVLAQGCIEELGLNVPAGPARPRRLQSGDWNPPVKENLEARLRRSHINLNERFCWNLRGPRTRIEAARCPPVLEEAPWARHGVRDGKMDLIDAIAYVDWLRDCVAAHKARDRLVRVLSIYDVANAQQLARRLLLETLGFRREREDERRD